MMGCLRRKLCAVALAVAIVGLTTACFLNPEAGSCVPQNPGSVTVRVQDPTGAPVVSVRVEVRGLPNCVGSFYSVAQTTGRDGVTKITAIDAGVRRVSITLPQGYDAGTDGVSRDVEVIHNHSVDVIFTILRL
jgi:hypothetical protein